MLKYLKFITAGAVVIALALPAAAQNSKFAFAVGGGFTKPLRFADGPLKIGYNFTASAGVHASKHVGLSAEFGFNHFGISDNTLAALAVPDGSSRIYSVTLQPTFHFNPEGRFDFYTTIGGGYYRRTIEFTEPTTAIITVFNPFIGFFPLAVPAQTVLGSFTQNKGGINGGVGVSVKLSDDSATRIFAETRYHHIFTSSRDTNYMPVTFGLRW